MKPKIRKIMLVAFLALLFSGMLVRYLNRVPKRHYCDFRVYHHAAQVFLSREDIYFRDNEEVTPYKYSPFFALLTSPLGLMPIKTAAAVFFTINFIATIALFFFARKICVDRKLSPKQNFWLYFLTILCVARFILQVWDSGQVNILMCALLAAGLYFIQRGKDTRAAALISASTFIKYTPAIFIPYFLLKKKFKVVGLILIFTLACIAIPAIYAGVQKNISYLSSWIPSIINSSLDQGSYFDEKNQSVYSLILRLTCKSQFHSNFIDLGYQTSIAVSYIIAMLLYLTALLPGKMKDSGKVDYALLFTLMPLFNPNGWMVNFVALIFPYMYLINYLIQNNSSRGLNRGYFLWGRDVFVLICVVLSVILASFTSLNLAGPALERLAADYSAICIAALLLTAALFKLKFGKVADV